MYLGTLAETSPTWPEAVAFLGIAFILIVLIGGAMAVFVDLRKTKIVAG